MSAAPKHVDAVWGLDMTSSSAELVRVDQRTIERRGSFSVADFAPTADLLNALAAIPANEPLAICFPDRLAFYRSLTLPASSPGATAKMVQAQAEAMLPLADGRLSWTWRASPDRANSQMQSILICAARRDVIEQMTRAVPANVSVQAILPRAATLPGSGLIIDASDESAAFALLSDDELRRCAVVDLPPDPVEVRHGYQSLIDGLPRDAVPKTGIVRAADLQDAQKLADALGDSLGISLKPEPASDSGAVAAARLLLDARCDRVIDFADTRDAPTAEPKANSRRLIAFTAACVAGIGALYGIDVWRGWWLDRQVQHLRNAESGSAGIETRLAIDRYLEKNASPALPGLDTILSAAPPSLRINTFGLAANGQFHLSGAVGQPMEVDQFLRKLQESKALTNVQLRSARVDQNRWSIELTADAAPMAGLFLTSSAPVKPTTQPTKRGGA
jgi:hypothetical protein